MLADGESLPYADTHSLSHTRTHIPFLAHTHIVSLSHTLFFLVNDMVPVIDQAVERERARVRVCERESS